MILIAPGHCQKTVGTLNKNKTITEYECNLLQAESLHVFLLKLGIKSDIADTSDDNLFRIGKLAEGYGALVVPHLNGFNGFANYCCVKVHIRRTTPKNTTVASKAAVAMSRALGIPCYNGTSAKGVMTGELKVLAVASTTSCPINILTEAFFLDYYSDIDIIHAKIQIAMKALALALKENL